jgi:hypothetical protein
MSTPIQPYPGQLLMPAFERATVAEIMRPGVMSCEPDVPAVTVARMMAAHHITRSSSTASGLDPLRRAPRLLVSDLDLARAGHSGIGGLTAADVAPTEPAPPREPGLP